MEEKFMARKKQDVIVLFPDLFVGTKRLTDAQFGVLMRALFAYRYENTEYTGEDVTVAMAFDFAKPQIDRYIEVCNTNRKNRNSLNDDEVQRNATELQEIQGNDPQIKTQNQIQVQNQSHTQNEIQNHNHNQNQDHTHNHPPVSPPSDQGDMGEEMGETYDEQIQSVSYPSYIELSRYCRAEGLKNVNPADFLCHYVSKRWTDQQGRPIKDWKALARSWNERNKASPIDREI